MGVRRSFIDWRRPALAAVVEFVCSNYERDGVVDLSNVIVVTPGGRAGRRFLEILAERTEGRNVSPQLATPGDLPEKLYQLKRPLADELTQQFAWVEALRGMKEEQVRSIVGQPPSDGDIQAWLAIGELIGKVHRELAADLKDFKDVAGLPMIHSARETTRWRALAAAQERYLALLDQLNLWDRQTARLEAIKRKEPATDCDILLIGLADMNGTLRAMLEQVAERVQVFVHAPEELSDRFDPFGILVADAWETFPIDLDDEWLRFADRPADQGGEVVEFVREQAEAGAAADDVVIGLADNSLASPVRAALEERGVTTRWIGGRTVGTTSVAKLLEAIASRLDSDLTTATSELIRHPEVSRWLDREGLPAGWLATVDEEVCRHAPRRLGMGRRNGPVSRAVSNLIIHLLAPLDGAARPLGAWTGPVCQVLEVIYGDRLFADVETDQRERQAVEQIRAALQAQVSIPESLSPATTASAAIRLALDAVSGHLLTPESQAEAVEMVGWLELPLGDAPSLVVCGMNDGFVPSSLNSDAFLPNGLREVLGLEDNRRRYARDAYALSVLTHSRKAVRFIAGRHDLLGDPLLPSRLVFATDELTMARRIRAAFGSSGTPAAAVDVAASRFSVPRPRPGAGVSSLSVTAFRDYLACRYRFYLKHVERLRPVEGLDGELTAAMFGTLIHESLRRWAESDAVQATDPVQIRNTLEQAFDEQVEEMLDEEPLPAVKLQLQQAKLRLKAFAEWQARHRREGWEVKHLEVRAEHLLALSGGKSMLIHGRIDRIDYNPKSDRWLIIDYKTGDKADGPDKVHLRSGEWVDLQLPLYRLLAPSLEITGQPDVAYVTLGKDSPGEPDEIFKPATWSAAQLAEADAEIRRVAEHVADLEFWTPASDPPKYDDYACIVQEGVFGREPFE